MNTPPRENSKGKNMLGFFRKKEPRIVRATSLQEAEQMVTKANARGQKVIIDLSDIDPEELNRILQPISAEKTKLGRNDFCPCGSGLKYKKCCLLN
jgi:uncharacterized protein YecA (UPF0149 family)